MKLKLIITSLLLATTMLSNAQEAVPTAKTKAERKAERKEMSLEERIEDILPVDVTLPSASINTPTDKISSVEDAKKYFNETVKDQGKKVKEFKERARKTKKVVEEARKEVFDGKQYKDIKVEKQIYRRGSGRRMQYIEFYTLADYQQPNPYVKSLFWYDERTKRIVEAVMRDRKTNHLMHGPYKEYRGETLVKEGFYYLGAQDGRWVTYDQDFILLDKVTYEKGFLEDAEITYYDSDSSKIKEVTPILYGEKTGDYYAFHEGGTLATEGHYDRGVKVGQWIEYYETGNRRKKVTRYGSDCYDETEPIVLYEYSPEGKMTFEHESVKRL